MGPEIIRILLQHIVVNVYKISNHSEVVVFVYGDMVRNASSDGIRHIIWIVFMLNTTIDKWV